MKKVCPICMQLIKNDDLVVALLLARYQEKEDSYGLSVMSQTISSHLYCVEVKSEQVIEAVTPEVTCPTRNNLAEKQ